jgi:tRNA pseudouridine32 synthase/23S rRNA pseudouridine746 synthase
VVPLLEHHYQPPEVVPLQILYEDGHLLVVEKPAGLLAVPGRGEDKQDSLIQRLLISHPDALVVHRLDMDTSGLMVFARSKSVQRDLGHLFQQRRVDKAYEALVVGRVTTESGEIDLPLIRDWPRRPLQKVDFEKGKPALTRYKVIRYLAADDVTRIRLEPVTGRSHQLRVHMQQLGHPILGDRLYGGLREQGYQPRLCLHASELRFRHPIDDRVLAFRSATPF